MRGNVDTTRALRLESAMTQRARSGECPRRGPGVALPQQRKPGGGGIREGARGRELPHGQPWNSSLSSSGGVPAASS